MAYDKFLVAPIGSGTQSNMRPWQIMDDAFELLNNVYTFRGRIRKRFGSRLLNNTVDLDVQQLHSRLRMDIGTTDINGDILGNVPGLIYKVGQMFSIGDEIFTVTTAGLQPMLTTGAAAVHTYNTATGAYDIQGADPLTDVYFYPAESVMGFAVLEDNTEINDETTFAYDTQFAYEYDGNGWERVDGETVVGDSVWTGTDSQFFWSHMYRGVTPDILLLFTSNFNAADFMRYYDGAAWTTFSPAYTAAANNNIVTARIIIQFHGRLLLLNTIETVGGVNTSYVNRCRYSQFGSPLDVLAWREDLPGRGNWLDAPTQEEIITAQIIKDRLIVYFERSTYELVYTGNQILPFVWQELNKELGAESTFSTVTFDRGLISVGNVGIHACNGAYVERIDDQIPNSVFSIKNVSDGVKRVHGIRDFFAEMVYWTYPSVDSGTRFPNRVLVYNYQNNAWAYNDDCFTCFGYYQRQTGLTWAQMRERWFQMNWTWEQLDQTSKFREVIAGNQEGFTFTLNIDESRNAPALQITNITYPGNVATLSIIDHNLTDGDYILIENASGLASLNDAIYQVRVTDANTITLLDAVITDGPYEGAGTAARVSNPTIRTKQYNFYNQEASNLYVGQVDFNISITPAGEITVDSAPSSSRISLVNDATATGAILGTNILDTWAYSVLETTQERAWHTVFLQIDGDCVQLDMYFREDQIRNPQISLTDFQLHGMIFYAMKASGF